VEDDPNFCRVLLDLAHGNGFKGIVATDGAQAIELAKQFRPSAITLDIGLGDISGWKVLDELHADLALADTWVAETVIPFVEHGVSDPARIDVVNELRKLRSRAEELGRASDGEEARLAASYRDYFDVLLRVYAGFLTRAPKSR